MVEATAAIRPRWPIWRSCERLFARPHRRAGSASGRRSQSGTSSRHGRHHRADACWPNRISPATPFPNIGSLCLNMFCCRPRPEWDFERYLTEHFGAARVSVRQVERPYRVHDEPASRQLPELRRARQVPLVERRADHLRILPLDPGPHDVDLEKVGRGRRPAARQPRPSRSAPKASIGNKPFVVIGRIIYEYEQGGWNEWHIVFNDGTAAGCRTRSSNTPSRV